MLDFNTPDVAFALEAVRRAAALARRVQEDMVLVGVQKSDLSPVTVGDYAVQAMVANLLSHSLPNDILVAEEDAAALQEEDADVMRAAVRQFVALEIEDATEQDVVDWVGRGSGEPAQRFWTLDPIDGTKGYLRGEHYAIALALIEDGRVILGALACPHLPDDAATPGPGAGAILIAKRGQGAWCSALSAVDAQWRPIRVSTQTNPQHARILRSVEAGHTNVDDTTRIAQAMGVTADPVCMDSQAKYGLLAAGGAEILLRLMSPKQPDYKEKIWDQAAGSIVLEEAGGRITDLHGQPLDFSQGRTLARNTGVIATNGALHELTFRAFRSVRP